MVVSFYALSYAVGFIGFVPSRHGASRTPADEPAVNAERALGNI